MRPSFRNRYICQHCFRAGREYSSSASSISPVAAPAAAAAPHPPPSSGAVRLSSRGLLILHGRDAADFLHGITTGNIRSGLTTGFYSAFLNAQGRVLNDVFIYPASHSKSYTSSLSEKLQSNDPAFFIEVDASQVETLVKHLKRYKLRAKVDIRAVDEGEWNTWSLWNSDSRWTAHTSGASDDGTIGCVDARAPGMGQRLITRGNEVGQENLRAVRETTLDAYTIRRMARGVPEGQVEIAREASLPHECNIDFMGGIDFKKGCYVGQELTIRTQHTGVVRKRILPVSLYSEGEQPPEKVTYNPHAGIPAPRGQSNILPANKTGRSAGKFLAGVGNIGLGLCRIEKMTDIVLTAEGSGWGPADEFKLTGDEIGSELRIKAFVPDWIRNNIKVRDPQRRIGG